MSKHLYYPQNIGVELVRGCNFSCVMCPVTANAPFEKDKLQFMDLALLEEIVEEIDRWGSISAIWFFNHGEPLFHPHYRQCLEILYRSVVARQALVVQYTNAALLSGDKAQAILDIPIIKKLVFSFDGFGDKESYERLRGEHFQRVLENIRRFAENSKQRRPDLQLATCTILPRPGEVPDLPVSERAVAVRQMSELFTPWGIQVEVRDMHNYSGNDALLVRGKEVKHVFGGCAFVEEDSLYFSVNGWAQPCCAVYDESFRIGRFPNQRFGELLNSPQMQTLRHALRLDRRADLPFCKNCKLSAGGVAGLDKAGLLNYWKKREQQQAIYDLEERRYIFEEVAPSEYARVRLDLGCGREKTPDFIGLDRFALPGVDIVADLDRPLPFANDSVDLVFASHSLEHVTDLTYTMQEIYRICKHGAQVCILAPYFQQGVNLANPYHRQIFNEHSPRFWTNSQVTLVKDEEYTHPSWGRWGLSESDSSAPGFDFRCLQMKFFYFPEYRNLPEEEQRAARKKYLDVCDQILYHLVVIKQSMSEVEMQELAQNIEYYEPSYTTIRTLREGNDFLEGQLKQVQEALQTREAELMGVQEALQTRESELMGVQEALQTRESELMGMQEALQTRESELMGMQEALQTREAELAQAQKALQNREMEFQRQVQLVRDLEKRAYNLAESQKALEVDFKQREAELVRDLQRMIDKLRGKYNQKSYRYLEFVSQRFSSYNAWDDIDAAFQQLKDDSLIFYENLKRYRLRPGPDLSGVPFTVYPLKLGKSGLKGILLAPVLELPVTDGRLGIEIVSPDGKEILAQVVAPCHSLSELQPVRFDFAPIANTAQRRLWLRVFARDVESPVRVFEWCSYWPFGLGPRRAKAFCGFIFQG